MSHEDLAAHLRKAHFELGESVVEKLGVAHFNASRNDDGMAFGGGGLSG